MLKNLEKKNEERKKGVAGSYGYEPPSTSQPIRDGSYRISLWKDIHHTELFNLIIVNKEN
jgi:hypothetical protein